MLEWTQKSKTSRKQRTAALFLFIYLLYREEERLVEEDVLHPTSYESTDTKCEWMLVCNREFKGFWFKKTTRILFINYSYFIDNHPISFVFLDIFVLKKGETILVSVTINIIYKYCIEKTLFTILYILYSVCVCQFVH